MTNKRKYIKRTVSNERVPEDPAVTDVYHELPNGDAEGFSDSFTYSPLELGRRRSEKPKDAKPEVKAVDVPKLDNLGANEVTGLVEEAIYAHDMQDAVVRFDTVGRKWTFRPDQELGQTVFYIECAIPAFFQDLTISNSRFGLDGSRDEVKLAIEQLDEAVR